MYKFKSWIINLFDALFNSISENDEGLKNEFHKNKNSIILLAFLILLIIIVSALS